MPHRIPHLQHSPSWTGSRPRPHIRYRCIQSLGGSRHPQDSHSLPHTRRCPDCNNRVQLDIPRLYSLPQGRSSHRSDRRGHSGNRGRFGSPWPHIAPGHCTFRWNRNRRPLGTPRSEANTRHCCKTTWWNNRSHRCIRTNSPRGCIRSPPCTLPLEQSQAP